MKHTFKRALSLLLALALLCTVVPTYTLPAAAAGENVAINAENFPDENFRAYVCQFDTDGDGALSAAEIARVKWISCAESGITSLQGIEFFTALDSLDCVGNQLTALDVSKNTALAKLYCSYNQLTALDVSQNNALDWLYCEGTQLTSLDVSKNIALTGLYCSYNQLTSLDVSKNIALKGLSCSYNQLTSLDVSKNIALKGLDCYDNQLTILDVNNNTELTRLDCYDNQLTTLDVSKNTALTQLDCSGNQLTSLDSSKNVALEWLDCSYNQLTDLNLSNHIALRELYCYGNQLTTLDVCQTPALEWLYCFENQLTTLDVSQTTALTELSCYDNQLTTLDVSGNTELVLLQCSGNQLSSLDLSQNATLSELSCQGNQLATLDISHNPRIEYTLLNGFRDPYTQDYCYYYTYAEDYQDNNWNRLSFDFDTVILLSDGSTFQGSPFTDVKPSSYYFNAVLWAVQNGVTSGTGEGLFSPKQTCTRAQVMTFLWKAYGAPEPASMENPFSDVQPGKYYEAPILWAYHHQPQITGGLNDTTFGVKKSCTRAQVVMFLWAAAGKPEPTTTENPFSDVKETDYFYKAVLWAVENGITGGTTPTTFSPKQTCTRAQVVTFLYKAVG